MSQPVSAVPLTQALSAVVIEPGPRANRRIMKEYRLAIVAVAATFALLLIGGTVNPTGSSLACPEATFICHGQYLPPMTGGVLYEHGHRLWAQGVGLIQLALTILIWRRRPALRRLAVVALIMVGIQATLGALTVYYKLPWAISTFHLLVGFVYFATTLLQAYALRRSAHPERRAREAGPESKGPSTGLGRARVYIYVGLAFVFAQILLGGLVRHHEAALACIDLPLCAGSLYPDGSPPNLIIHMTHRLGGVIAGLAVFMCAFGVWRASRGVRAMRLLALAAPLLVSIQFTLGVLTVYTLRSTPIAVAHFGGAVALWGVWVGMWLITRQAKGTLATRTSAGASRWTRHALRGPGSAGSRFARASQTEAPATQRRPVMEAA